MSKEGLWRQRIEKNYISPGSMMHCVRSQRKSINNMSIHWKALVQSFDVISNHLAWRVGNGEQVRVGAGSVMGCGEGLRLPEGLITLLQERGISTLNQVGEMQSLGLEGERGLVRGIYILQVLKVGILG